MSSCGTATSPAHLLCYPNWTDDLPICHVYLQRRSGINALLCSAPLEHSADVSRFLFFMTDLVVITELFIAALMSLDNISSLFFLLHLFSFFLSFSQEKMLLFSSLTAEHAEKYNCLSWLIDIKIGLKLCTRAWRLVESYNSGKDVAQCSLAQYLSRVVH